MKEITIFLSILGLFFTTLFPASNVLAVNNDTNLVELDAATNVPTNKVWRVTFNKQVNVKAFTDQSVYVLDASGNKVATQFYFEKNDKVLVIEPPANGYATNSSYKIVINEDVRSTSQQTLKQKVYKTFTTKREKAVAETFVPRANSENKMTLQDDVKEVTKDEVIQSLEDEKIILKNNQHFEVGDVLTLPPNNDYPFGRSGRITALDKQGDNVRLTLTEASLSELIKSVDLSNKFPTQPMNLKQVNANSTKSEEGPSFNFERDVNVYEEGNNLIVDIKKILLEAKFDLGTKKKEDDDKKDDEFDDPSIKIKGEGNFDLKGTITIKKPEFVYSSEEKSFLWIDYEIPTQVGIESHQDIDLTGSMSGNIEGSAEIPLKKIPLGTGIDLGDNLQLGMFLELILVININANGNLEYSFKQAYSPEMGVKVTDDKKIEPYQNLNKTGEGLTIDEYNINASMDDSIHTNVDMVIGDQKLAQFLLDPKFNVYFSAQNLYEDGGLEACYQGGLTFEPKVELNFIELTRDGISEELKNYYRDSFKFPITKVSKCQLSGIQFADNMIAKLPGGKGKFKVEAKTKDLDDYKTLKLPQDAIYFESNSKYLEVESDGSYQVSEDAEMGSLLQAAVKYYDGKNTVIDKIDIIVANPEDIVFEKNYSILNKKDETSEVAIPSDAYYAIYDESGALWESAYNSKEKSKELYDGQEMILSYRKAPEQIPRVIKGNATITETAEQAFTYISLKQNEGLKLSMPFINDYTSTEVRLSENSNVQIARLYRNTDQYKMAQIEFKNQRVIFENDEANYTTTFIDANSGDAYEAFDINIEGVYLIKNVGKKSIKLSAPTRAIQYEQTTIDPYTKKIISPGEAYNIQVSDENLEELTFCMQETDAEFDYEIYGKHEDSEGNWFSSDTCNDPQLGNQIHLEQGEIELKNEGPEDLVFYYPTGTLKFKDISNNHKVEYELMPGKKYRLVSEIPDKELKYTLRSSGSLGFIRVFHVYKNKTFVEIIQGIGSNDDEEYFQTLDEKEIILENFGEMKVTLIGIEKYTQITEIGDVEDDY